MSLSNELISQFAKIAVDKPKTAQESTMFGTIVTDLENGSLWLVLDGSDRYTPISNGSSTVAYKTGDRVMVLIKNHSVTIIGNVTSKPLSDSVIQPLGSKVTELEYAVANSVTTEQLAAVVASVDRLHADNVTINGELDVAEAAITELQVDNIEVRERLVAHEADISHLETEKLDAKVAEAEYAKIDDLAAVEADIYDLEATHAEFQEATAKNFESVNANIGDLNTKKLSAAEAALTYATIDFSNIGEAAIKRIFSETGMIKDLVVGDQTISGELVGVTLSGDLIRGNTVKADKLVVRGDDGLYYKLNVNALGETAVGELSEEDQETLKNGLHGSNIIAKTITAEKISVNDLVAFGATIGGFHIGNNSLYSGAKSSVSNTTRGIYLDNDGQVAFGDSNNFVKFYKDTNGAYKLSISADSIVFGSSNKTADDITKAAEDALNTVQDLEERANSGEFAGEDATVLRIDSSRGTVFKNNQVSTVLSVVIYKGSKRITDITELKKEYGDNTYLQWQWQKMDETAFGTIVSTDSRIGQNGFTFTLSPSDVSTKITFMCQLITD